MILYTVITPYLGHLFNLNLGHSFEFSAAISMSVHPTYAGRTEMLYNFCIRLYMSLNHYLLAELPVAPSTSIPYPQVWILLVIW